MTLFQNNNQSPGQGVELIGELKWKRTRQLPKPQNRAWPEGNRPQEKISRDEADHCG